MASPADPDVRQAMEQFRGYIATDHGLILVVLLCLAVAAIFFLIFSALGGRWERCCLAGRAGARNRNALVGESLRQLQVLYHRAVMNVISRPPHLREKGQIMSASEIERTWFAWRTRS